MTATGKKEGSKAAGRLWLVKVVVGLLFVAVLAVPLLIEFRARTGHAESLQRLQDAIRPNGVGHGLSLSKAELLIAGKPDRHSRVVDGERWEIFEWSGVAEDYLIAIRVAAADTTVQAVETWGKLPPVGSDSTELTDAPSTVAPPSKRTPTVPAVAAVPPDKVSPDPIEVTKVPPAVKETVPASFSLPTVESQKVDPQIVNKVRSLAASSKSSASVLANPQTDGVSHRSRWLGWYHMAHREAYKKFGSRDPKWDAKVDRFLVGFAQRNVDDPDAPDLAELLVLANEIEAAGCADSLVLSVHSHISAQTGQRREALRLIRQVEAIDDSRYPSRWQLSTRVRSLRGLQTIRDTKISQLRQQVSKRARDCIVQTIADESLDDAGRRLHQQQITTIVGELLQKNELQQLAAALQRDQRGDRWLNCMALAKLHRRLGWIARGSGFSRTVSRQGWNSFNSHMLRTRALLLQAWDINPSLPESSMGMIEATLTVKGIVNEKPRFWFQQAVNADYEEPQTYNLYRWSLQPRWGGSTDSLLALGRDCLNGNQFDTDVPWQFHLSAIAAMSESKDLGSLVQSPQLFEEYKRLFEGYIDNDGPERRPYRESQLAAVAFLTNHHGEAEEMLRSLGQRVDPDAFADIGVALVTVREILQAKHQDAMPFSGHGGALQGVAALKEGLLVTASSDGTAKVWELKSKRELGIMPDHLHSLSTMTVAADREMVATGDIKGRVIVWNPALRREFHTLQIVPPVHALAFSRDRRLLATGGGDGHVRIWDLDDGRLAATLSAQGKSVGSLSFSADGRFLASTAVPNSTLETAQGWNVDPETQEVAVWDLHTLDVNRLRLFRAAASLAVFSNSGSTLAVAGWDFRWANSVIKFVDAKTGKTMKSCSHSSGRLHHILFSPDDRRLYAGAANGDVLVVDTADGHILATLRGHSTPVRSITLSPDAKTLISGDGSGVIHQWDVSSETISSQTIASLSEQRFPGLVSDGLRHGKNWLGTRENNVVTLWSSKGKYQSGVGLDVVAPGGRVTAFDMSADGELVAIATAGVGDKSEIVIIDSSTRRPIKRFKLPRNEWAAEIRFHPDRQSVALNERGKRISIWDISVETPLQKVAFTLPSQRLSTFDFSSDGRYLIVGTSRGQLVRWDLSGKELNSVKHEEILPPSEISGEGIVAVRSVPNSPLFVASNMWAADLWDVQSMRRITSFPGTAISVSPDGRWIAAAGGNKLKKETQVLEVSTRKLVRRLRGGHGIAVMSVVWSPDSQFLFTAGANGSIRRWDTKTGQVVLEP